MVRTLSIVTKCIQAVEFSRSLDKLTLSIGFIICKKKTILLEWLWGQEIGVASKEDKTVSPVLGLFYLQKFFSDRWGKEKNSKYFSIFPV